MAKNETKFNQLLSSEETKRSSDAHKVSAPVKREADKEFARREKERKARLRRLGLKDNFVPPAVRSIPDDTKKKKEEKTSAVDVEELKRLQEELKKEKGIQEPEIDYSYKKTEAVSEPEGSGNELTLTPPTEVLAPAPEFIPEPEPEYSEPLTQMEEEYVREEYQIPDEYKNNDHVSKISADEIEEIKRQLAIERGEIPPDEISNEEVNNIDESEEKPEELDVEQEESENKALEDIKKASRKQGGDFAAPEESLPDNITDEEIADLMKKQEAEEAALLEEEDEEDYSGMTDEEIAEAKARKRRLKELHARYSKKEAVQAGDEGDYRKSLDFSINTSIKRFKVKPPKKPIIIAISAVFLFLIVVGVVTYFILNKPPAPIVMASISLSQQETFQDVGEAIDLRGVYIDCKYSDGSIKKIKATENMISRKSDNIDEDNIIATYDRNTYVYFTINGFETMLEINVSKVEIQENGLTIEIIGESFTQGSTIKYEDILILGKTTANQTLRFDSAEAVYDIEDSLLAKYESGFVLPSDKIGDVTISVSVIHNGNVYSASFVIRVVSSI